jgi:translation initiation factor IF-1
MAREDLIELEGTVTAHSGSIYTVEVNIPGTEDGKEVVKKSSVSCHLSGKIRMNYIRILVGDHVQIRVSPYDLNNGTITYRFK